MDLLTAAYYCLPDEAATNAKSESFIFIFFYLKKVKLRYSNIISFCSDNGMVIFEGLYKAQVNWQQRKVFCPIIINKAVFGENGHFCEHRLFLVT